MKRTSTVIWKGSGKDGSGNITTQSHALDKVPYAWNTRFENKNGTNPEELIAAAHAGCFTMKLSFLLSDAGFKPDVIETTAEITLEKDSISHSHLVIKANVPGISSQKFNEAANNAKENCLVSKALNVTITMETSLNEKVMA
jgi:lipoyl-dependent peroxiredoxin